MFSRVYDLANRAALPAPCARKPKIKVIKPTKDQRSYRATLFASSWSICSVMICWSLSLVADYAEVVAGDANRRQKRMHEANHQIIDQARELAKTAEPRPGENEAATPVSTSVEPAKTAPPT